MHNISELKSFIEVCKEHNNGLRNSGDIELSEISSNGSELSSLNLQCDRLEKAEKINPAIGVFGQSQCGKSFLVSEIIGGANQNLLIDGAENPQFQDYNKQNADAESTGVVTRLTYRDSRKKGVKDKVFVRFLSPLEVMWSFTNGFFHEMNHSKGFDLTDELKQTFHTNIYSPDNGEASLLDLNEIISEFTECFNYVKTYWNEPPLTGQAIEFLLKLSEKEENISVEKFILLASTFWNCDKNITDAFRARIKTLEHLNFREEGLLPANLLKDTIDAGKLKSLTLKFNSDEMFSHDKGIILESSQPDPATEEIRLQNLQAIVKEAELTVVENNDTLLNNLDVLDFPGARATSGSEAGQSSDDITNKIVNNSSQLIKDMYKRGKLLYLFELYRKQHDITLLVLCSANEPPAAPILKTMLSRWINGSEIKENKDAPCLFTAFTKSDTLLKNSIADTKLRVEARFEDNFADYYSEWINDFIEDGNTYNNFYFVRNPEAANDSFERVEATEVWRQGFEAPSKEFRKEFLENEVVHKYLGDRKEELYDSVFYPNKHGIELLIQGIKDKYNSDPDIKNKLLKQKNNEIYSQILEYRDRYYSKDGTNTGRDKQNKEAALSFVNQLSKDSKYLPELLNGFYRTCPDSEVLWKKIEKINVNAQNANTITIASPYKEAIPAFIKSWLHHCKKQQDFHVSIGVEKNDLNKYLKKIEKYFLQPEFIEPIISSLQKHFNSEDYSAAMVVRNYLSWIFGEKIYFLEHKEQNGTPTKAIDVPSEINFNKYIIEIWKKQLPEIYVENYVMKEPTALDETLAVIK